MVLDIWIDYTRKKPLEGMITRDPDPHTRFALAQRSICLSPNPKILEHLWFNLSQSHSVFDGFTFALPDRNATD